MNNRLQQKLDLYHSGRMNAEEVTAFEKELASDPTLLAESNFQRDIINGLKDYRKTQLMARLDAIDVSPVWFDFIQQSTLLKSFGGVAVATLISAGVYFMAEPGSTEEDTDSIEIDSPKKLDFSFQLIKPAILSSENPKPVAINQLVDTEPVKEEVLSEIKTMDTEGDATNTSQEIFNPNFEAPSARDIKDEEALVTSSLDNLTESSDVSEDAEPIEVDYENTEELNIQYKYYDGKLFLSGDFNKAPYEILEINSANGRRIYVKYLNKFYKVGITDKLTIMPEVTNVNVIEELKLLRQNK